MGKVITRETHVKQKSIGNADSINLNVHREATDVSPRHYEPYEEALEFDFSLILLHLGFLTSL